MSLEIIEAALADLDRVKEKLERLKVMATADGPSPDLPLKDRGRLTEFGVSKLREWLDAGYSQSDIARALDITPAAVNHQRNVYLAERAALQR